MAALRTTGLPDRFLIGARVGQGAFGEVFRGRDLETHRDVAIKRLKAALPDAMARTRFELEAQLLRTVDSPYVVQYLHHSVGDDGEPYLVLEWLDGEDLSRRTRRAPLSRRQCVDVGRQVALGLDALHRAGIVHRDVKPSNLFVLDATNEIRVKLFDLGVARSSRTDLRTLDGVLIGTPAYMSPEQARGDRDIDARSDLFSLGVMLYELLAGRRPFAANDAYALLARIILSEPDSLRVVAPVVPATLADLIHRCMSKSPDDRPATALALAEALVPSTDFDGAAAHRSSDEPATVVDAAREVASAEQRVVTALFASLPGDSSQVDASRQRFHEIVGSHRGKAHSLLGRFAVAVFGLDRSLGNEALRAARAALALRDAVADCRLAISTCLILATENGVAGDALDRGVAQVKRASVGVSVDPATARLLEPYFVLGGAEDDPMLVGAREAEQESAPRIGRRTATVGRERELELLDAWLDGCIAGPHATGVTLTGDVGIGKSRVRDEFGRRAAQRHGDVHWVIGRADNLATGAAFGTIGSAIRRWAGVRDGEAASVRHAQLRHALAPVVPESEIARIATFLGELSDVPTTHADDEVLRAARRDRLLMHDALTGAFEDWLHHLSDQRAVVLVLEDLQWSDRASVQLVAASLRHLARSRLFAMAVGRPEVRSIFGKIWVHGREHVLELSPLSRAASLALSRELLGDSTAPEVMRALADRAEGNPFHLEELIRAARRGDIGTVPETVLGIVQSRLDEVDVDCRRVLRLASVFGRAFWYEGVAALAGSPSTSGQLGEALDLLVAQDLIALRDETRFPQHREYVFRHALVREVAYATLTPDDRARAHLRAAHWLQERGERDPAVLGRHFEQGGDPSSARTRFESAARVALDGNDATGALAHAQRAMALGVSGVARGRVLAVVAEAHRSRGELALAADAAHDALELLSTGSSAWYSTLAEWATAVGRLGRQENLEESATLWCSLEHAPEHRDDAVVSGARICAQLLGVRAMSDADSMLKALERMAGDETSLETQSVARLAQVRALRAIFGGDPATYLLMNIRGLAAMERAGNVRSATMFRVNVASAQVNLGMYEDAEPVLRRAMKDGERLGMRAVNTYGNSNLGHALARMGRVDEAVVAEAEAVRTAVEQEDRRIELISRGYLSAAWLAAGSVPMAVEEAERACSVEGVSPQVRVSGMVALANARLARGDVADARRIALDACAVIDGGGVEEGEAAARLALAEAHWAAGEFEAAREAIGEAMRRLEARVATIQDAAMRRSFLDRVHENARTIELHRAWVGP